MTWEERVEEMRQKVDHVNLRTNAIQKRHAPLNPNSVADRSQLQDLLVEMEEATEAIRDVLP